MNQRSKALHENVFKKFYRWVDHKIFLYNVTLGLYMLDWWERILFNMLVSLLIWFLCYNGFRFIWKMFATGLILL